MLNWPRDPDDELRMNNMLVEIERIQKETEPIKKESEQLRGEDARAKA